MTPLANVIAAHEFSVQHVSRSPVLGSQVAPVHSADVAPLSADHPA
eukprot:COSAG02_NODE_29223_length_573_cov_1.662447_1_plen_45_part_10